MKQQIRIPRYAAIQRETVRRLREHDAARMELAVRERIRAVGARK